jgi:uncharacterized Zn-binding protein involved in type VI secretion
MLITQVQGDPDTGGGIIETPIQNFVKANGILVSVDGSPVSDHEDHTAVKTANGSAFVKINGIAVNIFGRADTCGHTRAGTQVSWFTIEN